MCLQINIIDELDIDPTVPPERYKEITEELLIQNATRWFVESFTNKADGGGVDMSSKEERKKYFAGISILISNAFWSLPDTEFRLLAKSIRAYLYEHEKGETHERKQ